jgi:molecular chaperone GrpE (heat shock protein)
MKKEDISQIEKDITNTLIEVNELKNKVEKKETEKHDQLKGISLSIISILDSMEQISEWIQEKDYNKIEEVGKVTARYDTIYKKLNNILRKYGITKIEFPENKLIVGFCEVVGREPDPNRANEEIVSIIRNGYNRGKELIRAAEVVIVKN